MPKGDPLTEDEKIEVLVHRREGKSTNFIANELGRSRGCIQGFLDNPAAYGTAKSTGRPSTISNALHRRLIRSARSGKFTAAELVDRHSMPVGPRRDEKHTNDFYTTQLVVQRLGQPIRCYGKDFGSHKEGRRNFIEHVELNDKEGNKTRLRIKFNLKGPNGKAEAWAEVNKDMPTGEFVYLIVRTYTGELIKIQDQRQILQADSEEEREAMRRLLGQ
ncbi:hypothetical protein DYB34_009961 [Aphanomyces astaci]|uniref:Tc3 transposase DNA binding domain-containing protein n=1 Tax=Aphanomyces astaci TaxID=112090 RepID=A0A3R6YZH7_APHAT|nr:hypothetical protein DYB34_009961 [Aphanomyces astaci]